MLHQLTYHYNKGKGMQHAVMSYREHLLQHGIGYDNPAGLLHSMAEGVTWIKVKSIHVQLLQTHACDMA